MNCELALRVENPYRDDLIPTKPIGINGIPAIRFPTPSPFPLLEHL